MSFRILERANLSGLAFLFFVAAVGFLPGLEACAATTGGAVSASIPPAASRSVDFVIDIQPILSQRCYSCHGPDKQKGELRWDVKASAFKTGDHGPIIVPGNS